MVQRWRVFGKSSTSLLSRQDETLIGTFRPCFTCYSFKTAIERGASYHLLFHSQSLCMDLSNQISDIYHSAAKVPSHSRCVDESGCVPSNRPDFIWDLSSHGQAADCYVE